MLAPKEKWSSYINIRQKYISEQRMSPGIKSFYNDKWVT